MKSPGFFIGKVDAQALGSQVGSDIASSFQTFATQAAKGQLNLAQAASFLGKEILKDVLDAVAARLVNKGEIELALGAALLAGIVTAEAAPTHLIAGGMMMAAGIGLQMLTASLLAEGALVVKPTLAVVGEGGQPEAVIPASRFAEFGLTGGVQVSKLKMTFPDMKSLDEANHPDFSAAVSQELQAAYQEANQGKN